MSAVVLLLLFARKDRFLLVFGFLRGMAGGIARLRVAKIAISRIHIYLPAATSGVLLLRHSASTSGSEKLSNFIFRRRKVYTDNIRHCRLLLLVGEKNNLVIHTHKEATR